MARATRLALKRILKAMVNLWVEAVACAVCTASGRLGANCGGGSSGSGGNGGERGGSGRNGSGGNGGSANDGGGGNSGGPISSNWTVLALRANVTNRMLYRREADRPGSSRRRAQARTDLRVAALTTETTTDRSSGPCVVTARPTSAEPESDAPGARPDAVESGRAGPQPAHKHGRE